jgi:hypothetical protein
MGDERDLTVSAGVARTGVSKQRQASALDGPDRARAAYMRDYRKRKAAEAAGLPPPEPDPGLAAEQAAREQAQRSGVNAPTTTHGARSPRRVKPLAKRLRRALLAAEDCPQYLKDPMWGPAIDAWAFTEARVRLLREWIADKDFIAAIEETTDEEEETAFAGGKSRRVSHSRHVRSAADELHRAETLAATLRARLGLDPVARARLGRDVSQAGAFDLARFLAEQIPPDTAATAPELPAPDMDRRTRTASTGSGNRHRLNTII